MKIEEEKKTYKWLVKQGLSYKDIMKIKKIYDEEGITFNIRSFDINDFPDLRKYLNELDEKENKDFIKDLLMDITGINIQNVIKMLY